MFLKNFYSEKEKTMRCSVTIDNLGTLYFFLRNEEKKEIRVLKSCTQNRWLAIMMRRLGHTKALD